MRWQHKPPSLFPATYNHLKVARRGRTNSMAPGRGIPKDVSAWLSRPGGLRLAPLLCCSILDILSSSILELVFFRWSAVENGARAWAGPTHAVCSRQPTLPQSSHKAQRGHGYSAPCVGAQERLQKHRLACYLVFSWTSRGYLSSSSQHFERHASGSRRGKSIQETQRNEKPDHTLSCSCHCLS